MRYMRVFAGLLYYCILY